MRRRGDTERATTHRHSLRLARRSVLGVAGVCAGLPSLVGAAGPPAASPPVCQPPAISGVGLAFLGHISVISETDLPLCTTGSVTVSFHGDAAAGCARHGVCGVSGTDVWQPGTADLSVLAIRVNGRRRSLASISWDGNSRLIGAAARSTATGATTPCRDTRSAALGGLSYVTPKSVNGGVARVSLVGDGGVTLPTRCAGPLDVDVARAVPLRRVSGLRALTHRETVSFVSSRSFSAHGFVGSVDSTVVLTTGAPEPAFGGPTASPKPRRPTEREVSVSYRVTRLRGQVLAAWRSPGRPACRPLGVCGSRGSIRIVPRTGSGESIELDASGPIKRPYRDFLAALGLTRHGNPHGIYVSGGGSWRDSGSVTSQSGPDGIRCADTAALTGSSFGLRVGGGQLRFAYQPTAQAGDPLRTRCPGPFLGRRAAAGGVAPASATLHGPVEVRFHTSESFSDRGYRVTLSPDLSLALTRGKLATRTS